MSRPENIDRNHYRHVSMQIVADQSGLSKSTVSKVLNQHPGVSAGSRKKVHAACAKLGYRLNPGIQDILKRGLRGYAQNIAFVLARVEFANPSYASMIDGISQGLQKTDLHLILSQLTGNENGCYELPPPIRDGRAAGVLLSGKLTDRLVELVSETGIPFVVLGNYPKSVMSLSSSVSVDLFSLMHQAVRQLKLKGKKHIAFFKEDPENHYAKSAYEAYRNALSTQGYSCRDDLVFEGKFKDFNAFDVMEKALNQTSQSFDALICLSSLASREIATAIIAKAGRAAARGIVMVTVMDYAHRLPMPTLQCERIGFKTASIGVELLIRNLKDPQADNRQISFTPQLTMCEAT